jgi:hypothetical protein
VPWRGNIFLLDCHPCAFLSNSRDNTPNQRRAKLFNTLLLSLGAFFVSVSAQSFIEIAVFWVDDRADIARLAGWYQLARIVAFVDPLLNPCLVAFRTPSIRRRVHFYLFMSIGLCCALFCPWRQRSRHAQRRRRIELHHQQQQQRRRSAGVGGGMASRKHSASTRPSISSRRVSSATCISTESEITLRILCTRHFVRSSFLRRGSGSTAGGQAVSVI